MPQSDSQPCGIGSSDYWNEVVQRPDGFCLAAIGVRWPENSRTAVEGFVDDHFDLNDLKAGDATASDCSTARATSARFSSRLLALTLTTTVYSMVEQHGYIDASFHSYLQRLEKVGSSAQ